MQSSVPLLAMGLIYIGAPGKILLTIDHAS
jgi:hypothetical protein